MKQDIRDQILASIETKRRLSEDETLIEGIERVARRCVSVYRDGGKLLIAGNGGSAADAQHIAAELVGRYGFDRPSLSALALTVDTSALTAIGNDYGYDQVFSRQLEGVGNAGDLFIGISTSGNSANILNAVRAARAKGIATVGLTGEAGGAMAELCEECLRVPSACTPRIQESHILIAHLLCDLIERELFGAGANG